MIPVRPAEREERVLRTSTWLEDSTVAIARERAGYAGSPPYPPSEAFPEWPDLALGGEDNPAYRAVRLLLRDLGLDARRFGTAGWNPLGDLVAPGETVVLKPNLVSHRNHARSGGTDCLVTHGSFVRAVVDYAARALGRTGRVIVGDCPVQGASWRDLVAVIGLDEVLRDASRRFPGIEFSSGDYRLTRAVTVRGRVAERRSVEPDRDRRFLEVELGADSLLLPLMDGRFDFGVAQYPRRRMKHAHSRQSNRYVIARDFLDANLFINLPKVKIHQKAGITCALKNLVGVNGHKDYLPHFRFGSPRTGGDEYPDGLAAVDFYWRLVHAEWERDGGPTKRLLHAAVRAYGQLLRRILRVPPAAFARGGGSWSGNDTLWRTVLDVNRAFLWFDPAEGALGREPRRRFLTLADGLVGGERESPLAPAPVAAGFALASRNPLALDTVAATLMGLDWRKLPQLSRAYGLARYPLATFGPEDVVIRGQPGIERVGDIHAQRAFVRFQPSIGWQGHVEHESAARASPSRSP